MPRIFEKKSARKVKIQNAPRKFSIPQVLYWPESQGTPKNKQEIFHPQVPYWPEFWTKNKDLLSESSLFNQTSPVEDIMAEYKNNLNDVTSYMDSLFFKTQCSLSAIQAYFEGPLFKKHRKYILHSIDGGFVTYVRSDLRQYLEDLGPVKAGPKEVQLQNRQDTLWKLWLDGWFCIPKRSMTEMIRNSN
jgi:hypothetical protein